MVFGVGRATGTGRTAILGTGRGLGLRGADTTLYDDLPAFAAALSSATIGWSGGRLEYESPARGRLEDESPARGRLEFGWDGDLRVDGSVLPVDGYPRLDSPYGPVKSGETTSTVSCHNVTSAFTTGSAVGEGSRGRSATGARSLVDQAAKEHAE